MQSSPSSGGAAWWQQPGQPQAPTAPTWVTGTPAQAPAAPASAGSVPTGYAPPGQAWWERSKVSLGPPAAPSPAAVPAGPLDVRALLHPSEHSRLVLALSVSGLTFAIFIAIMVAIGDASAVLVIILTIAALAGSIWLSLQIARSRLLGGAVRVSNASLPELQAIFDEVRARLRYHESVDVYISDKVTGGSSMTSYLGTGSS